MWFHMATTWGLNQQILPDLDGLMMVNPPSNEPGGHPKTSQVVVTRGFTTEFDHPILRILVGGTCFFFGHLMTVMT